MSDHRILSESEQFLLDRRVTEWLNPYSKCGDTAYVGCVTNKAWCYFDAKRLKAKGIDAVSVTFAGKIAVFMLHEGETVADIERMLVDAKADSCECEDSE